MAFDRLTNIALAAGLLFLCDVKTPEAETFRTVSVFSSIDAKRFVNEVNSFAKRNPTVNQLSGHLNFEIATNLKDVQPADQNAIPLILNAPQNVSRRNLVNQNIEQLNVVLAEARANKDIVPVLSMDLFQNVGLKIVVRNITQMPDETLSIAGTVEGMPGSVALLTKKGSALNGTIRTYTDVFRIQSLASTPVSILGSQYFLQPSRTVIVDQIIPKYDKEAEPVSPPKSDKKSSNDFDLDPSIGDDPNKPEPPPRIDFAVFYTPKAEAGSGGTEQIRSLIAQAIQSVQFSFDSYQIRATVRLVYAGKTDYPESGDISADLSRIQNPADNYMDEIPKIRNQVKADVVALIVDSAPPYCGKSYIPEDYRGDYSDYAYMVVTRKCAVENLSFVHEFGHVAGARHDRYVDNTDGRPIANNHGIIFRCRNNYCRDIMAYEDYCVEQLQSTCPRQSVWSGIVWSGEPPVPASATTVLNNTQRAIRIFLPIVAKYR